MLDGLVASGPEEVGPEGCLQLPLSTAAPNIEKNVLNEIFGHFRSPHLRLHKVTKIFVVDAKQRFEGRTVSFLDSSNQLTI
jgi:hypothetical protein